MRRPGSMARHRTTTLRSFALLAAMVVAVACGDDTPADPEPTGGDEAGEAQPDPDPATEPEDDDADEAPDSPGVDRVIDTSLTAEDGWSDPHDVDIPAPGNAVLEIEGRTFEFGVQCQGTGVVGDDVMDGNQQLNRFVLFNFLMTGPGQSDEFGNVRVTVRRAINVAGDRALQIRNMEWGGDGQFDTIDFSGVGQASSRIQSPSSVDPDGARLPVVRVSPEGIVTAQGEMTREFEDDTAALEGPFTFAGRCQETWPEDQA